MSIKQISVFVENKPGTMCEMTKVLADHGVDMRALSLAETEDFGIVRIIVDDLDKAGAVLKEEGYIYSAASVLGVAIPDTPGGLNKVLEVLREGNVNVDYMYAFLGTKDGHAYMIFKVADADKASAVLAAKGIQTINQDDMAGL